ncbi:macro domain-containing protein [Paenibacillus terrae]|uniref:Thoeris protein ThsA Macro domain-containing protein n=1 Tax=Paenibacillus terrae TaxID=159743 RepID=A0A0D7WUB2_9BACL|nr:macro domain-containing protein [Paenibacillus terrae]KJD42303.1 hypothetical protein QD47_29025 [Paenibacillus terrae]
MIKKIKVFFSSHVWKVTFSFKGFVIKWLSVFSVIWMFINFVDHYMKKAKLPMWDISVWYVLIAGIIIAIWLSRPRLTRTVRLKDKDITITIKVDDMFRQKGSVAIIPTNVWFKLDHVPEASSQVQYKKKFFSNEAEFNSQLESQLIDKQHVMSMFNNQPIKEFPIGTVIRIETPTKKMKAAYMVVTAKLNSHGRGIPSHDDLKQGLAFVWEYISTSGAREPLVIPIMGSGRHRINVNRFELMHDIVESFLQAIHHNKFTEELTLVIHPDSFLRHEYSLDDMEEYLRYMCKFGSMV